MVKSVCIVSLDVDSYLRCVDVFVRVAFFDGQGYLSKFYRRSVESLIFGLEIIVS